jgi:hypothetical protein
MGMFRILQNNNTISKKDHKGKSEASQTRSLNLRPLWSFLLIEKEAGTMRDECREDFNFGADDYYSGVEVWDLVDDIEKLKEYLYGWPDAMKDGKYKKKYVDMYCNR